MNLLFLTSAWEEYLYWAAKDKKVLKRINDLIKACQRSPFEGLGKPEPLKFDLVGCWSRRITMEHRLVYRVENENLIIIQCRYHY